MKPVIGLLLFIVTYACFYSCEKKDEATRAIVITDNVTILNPNNAIVTGKVLDNGRWGTWDQGVMWWEQGGWERGVMENIWPPPEYTYHKKSSEQYKPDIKVRLTGLYPDTIYYTLVYAVNIKGTAYGKYLEFQTPGLVTGTFTDNRDGKIYKWVELGSQTWMVENMAYIPYVCPPDSRGGYGFTTILAVMYQKPK